MRPSLVLLPLALAIPASSSEPPTATSWTVADVTAVTIDGDAGSLSPDGTLLAGIGETADGDDTICVWAVDDSTAEPTCADEVLPITRNPMYSTIRWSPDSTRVAFDLDTVQRGFDSDVMVFDVASGELSNLTDDGFEGGIFIGRSTPGDSEPPNEVPADILPAWSPDGSELVFSRTPMGESSRETSLLRIPVDGGEPSTIVDVSDEPFTVWSPMFWGDDGTIVYTHFGTDPGDPQNGLWTVPAGGGDPEQVIPGDSDGQTPQIVAVDAGGSSVSVVSLSRFNQPTASYEDPLFWIADLETATVEPLPPLDLADDAALPQSSIDLNGDTALPVVPPAISPDGSTALAVYRVFRTGELRLVSFDLADFTATPIGDAALFADDGTGVPSVHSLQWATDDRVLMVTGDGALVIDLATA